MTLFRHDIINSIDGLRAGPSHQFLMSRDTPWTGYKAECLLRQYGILVWGRYLSPNEEAYGFSVPLRQADWAEYVLLRAKVPVISRLYNEKHLYLFDPMRRASKPMGGGGRKSKGIGKVMDVLSWLSGFDGEMALPKVNRRKASRPGDGWLSW